MFRFLVVCFVHKYKNFYLLKIKSILERSLSTEEIIVYICFFNEIPNEYSKKMCLYLEGKDRCSSIHFLIDQCYSSEYLLKSRER